MEKEAFERARSAYGLGAYDDATLEFVFPELRESEDERIRKHLIEIVETYWGKTNEPGKAADLAWLEKQKEQKPVEVKDPFSNANFVRGYESGYADAKREQKPAQTDDEKEYIRTLKSLISDFIRDKQPEDVAFYQKMYDWLDGRHIEQKHPNGCFTCDEYKKGYEEGRRNGFTAGYNKAMKEQKPAEWSEEDERILKGIIGKIDHDQTYGVSKAEMLSFLKSLRPSWKPSEDEERLIKTSISFLKDFADTGWENAVECIDWLKSKLK